MPQHSGFENRFIDVCLYHGNIASEQTGEVSYYAPVFKPTDTTSLTIFPGEKIVPFSSANAEGNVLPPTSIILPIALFVAVILFSFLKNTLKSSIGSLFLVGFSPKFLQETDRRQIERNALIINSINSASFFSVALILYAFVVRFDFLSLSFEMLNISERSFYLALFLAIVGIVFGFFYARGGFIAFLGNVFSVSKMMKEYQKSYKLFFVSMSPVLLLSVMFMAFAPYSFIDIASVGLLVCMMTGYVIFVAISLFKFSNFTNRYSIHIFLYLCTLEILPLIVMAKFLQNVGF
jgi:hypothetical protein